MGAGNGEGDQEKGEPPDESHSLFGTKSQKHPLMPVAFCYLEANHLL